MHRHTLSRLTAGFAAGFFALLVAWPAAAIEYTSQGAVTLRESGAHTTDKTIQFVNDAGYCGAFIMFDVTDDPASAIVTIVIQIVETASNQADTYESITETINTDEERKTIQIGTSTPAASNVDEIHDRQLPYRFNIFLDHTDADEISYSASIQFLRLCPILDA